MNTVSLCLKYNIQYKFHRVIRNDCGFKKYLVKKYLIYSTSMCVCVCVCVCVRERESSPPGEGNVELNATPNTFLLNKICLNQKSTVRSSPSRY